MEKPALRYFLQNSNCRCRRSTKRTFGQLCTKPGIKKPWNRCFMLMNTGDKPVYSKNNLLTTVAWKLTAK
jgi:glycerol kinase